MENKFVTSKAFLHESSKICQVNLNERIGKNIKHFRKVKGLSQSELADKIEMNRSSIAYWEAGKISISIDSFVKIAKAFDIPISDLLKNYDDLLEEQRIKNENISTFNNFLIREKVLNEEYKLTNDDYERIVDFLKVNIKFIVNKKDTK